MAIPELLSEGICAVCARRETGIGFNQRGASRDILWLCDDPACLSIAIRRHSMKQDRFTHLESLAAAQGADEGRAYLEQIGKTDISRLSLPEYHEFSRRIIAGYRKALKENLLNG